MDQYTRPSFLIKPVLAALRDYEQQLKTGNQLTFDPVKLGVENADYWEKRNEGTEDQGVKKIL
ncbi:hypothetical protein ACFSCZ_15980 [Siminovitchia sediminis]|uniref:Uncharacterized protein n=1 Tax=Siminovitchia sediminis TaxID=1274353 RepID=A0ABW4KJY1_9BACI